MLEFCTPVVFASQKTINYNKKHFNININTNIVSEKGKFVADKLNVVNVWKEEVAINFGVEDYAIGSYAIKSLEAGCHVFLEKPVAPTLEGCRKVLQKAKECQKKLTVGYILRHHPSWCTFIQSTDFDTFC